MTKRFVGIDGEMTGTRRMGDFKDRLCQIGVALGTNLSFGSDIGWEVGDYTYQDQSLKVNGFTHRRITDGPPAAEVDEALYEFLTTNGIGPKEAMPVGFAVGTFDMPFVRETLPKSADLFSWYDQDLSDICLIIDEAKKKVGVPRGKGAKEESKRFAEEIMGYANWHDAEYDAIAATLSHRYLLDTLADAFRG